MPIPGLVDEFFKNFPRTAEMEGNMRLLTHSAPADVIVNFDNPGLLILAMRGIIRGDDICKAHTAYILALAITSCRPELRNNVDSVKDPKRLVWIHGAVCKVLGSAYCALPVPEGRGFTTDHIIILMDIIVRAANLSISSKSEDWGEMLMTLRYWHCPKYIKQVASEAECKKWSFERPSERAECFLK